MDRQVFKGSLYGPTIPVELKLRVTKINDGFTPVFDQII
jgi:hypothetical protein